MGDLETVGSVGIESRADVLRAIDHRWNGGERLGSARAAWTMPHQRVTIDTQMQGSHLLGGLRNALPCIYVTYRHGSDRRCTVATQRPGCVYVDARLCAAAAASRE
jgi:hypothetical protein